MNIYFFYKEEFKPLAFDTVCESNTRKSSVMNHAVHSLLNTVLIIGLFDKTLTTHFSGREDSAIVKSCFQCVKDTCIW